MIQKVSLSNFKCFEKMECELKNVNILTGLNGMGKSTVIQSLLLLRQSSESGKASNLKLNGEYVKLGIGRDVLYEKAVREEIEFMLEYTGGKSRYVYEYDTKSDEQILIDSDVKGTEKCPVYAERFTYLSAFRIEPQKIYGMTNKANIQRHAWGNNGEFSLQYLKEYGSDDVVNSHIFRNNMDDPAQKSIANQVNEWLQMISPDVRVNIEMDQLMNRSELRFEFVEGENTTNLYKCINVGFGLTYVLPIIIALVSAECGDIVILENPEAHIHPKGQRMLGELIARAGASGAQIIVETHSDHILNGVRLAVKHHCIAKEQVELIYFYKDQEDGYRHKCEIPHILDNGKIDHWPEGFFDEWENALLDLV